MCHDGPVPKVVVAGPYGSIISAGKIGEGVCFKTYCDFRLWFIYLRISGSSNEQKKYGEACFHSYSWILVQIVFMPVVTGQRK